MATCKTCGADIIWTETENGKRMPVDGKSVKPKGLFVLEPGDPPTAISVSSQRAPGLYESHFASCPQADEHRR